MINNNLFQLFSTVLTFYFQYQRKTYKSTFGEITSLNNLLFLLNFVFKFCLV